MSDEIESKKREIERKYNDIQRRINLKELQSKLTDTATDIAELPERIAGLRSRGYAFANYLEGKSETLAKQWDEIREQANATIREQAHGKTESVRARLTYTTKSKEDYGYALILSRARFIAPATYPLRFYQEYFKADREIDVEKRRYRWRITFKGVEFFVNFDEIDKPSGTFVEIKSTT